jgi:hypothetical protein
MISTCRPTGAATSRQDDTSPFAILSTLAMQARQAVVTHRVPSKMLLQVIVR